MTQTFAISTLCFLLIACSGSGDGLDANGRPVGSGSDVTGADFKTIQDSVLTPACTVCHAGGSAPRGLRLEESVSFSMLVSVPSDEVPELLRVAPGDPDNSYLVQKIEGTASVGGRMPLNGPPLPRASIELIRQWIAAGAPLNGGGDGAAGGPPAVTSVSVSANDILTVLPTRITVTFSAEMDPTLVTGSTVVLERSGGDGSFGEGNEAAIMPASVALVPNARTATMDLNGVASIDDTYRITVVGTGGSAVADTAGELLDGDGDGGAGGDHVVIFVVSATPTGPPGASAFDQIQATVFTPLCTQCHAGGNAPEGLRLDAANAFGDLVNRPSGQVPGTLRVNPGSPNVSYLIQKLEGTAAEGERMPRGGDPLPQATFNFIRQWITDGALRDGAPSTPPPPAPPPPAPLQPTFKSIQDRVFTPICTRCHAGGDPPGDLDLSEGRSYGLLVNVESDEESGDIRVNPGNANASYLIDALEGRAEDTPRMPLGGPYLPQSDIDIIRQWIDNGAQP